MGDDVAHRIRLGNLEDNLDRPTGRGRLDRGSHGRTTGAEAAAHAASGDNRSPGGDYFLEHLRRPAARAGGGPLDAFKARLLGTHFFNPPRYLKLLELIPTANTDSQVVAVMRTFAEYVVGKGRSDSQRYARRHRQLPRYVCRHAGHHVRLRWWLRDRRSGRTHRAAHRPTEYRDLPVARLDDVSTGVDEFHALLMVFGLRRSPWWPRHAARRWAAGWSFVCMPTRSWG